MTVTQKASGQADALATALAVTISRLRTQSGHPGIACTPELNARPALLTEGQDLTLQIDWQDGDHWRNDQHWDTDPGDRWDVHIALSFAGDRVCSTASNYEFGGTSRPDWLITRLLDIWHAKRLEV